MSGARVSRLGCALLLAALVPASVWAQGQTGTIAGNVKDTTGAILPGVTVEVSSPALIEKTRSAVTDGEGAGLPTAKRYPISPFKARTAFFGSGTGM